MLKRKIIKIDEAKCTGCGLCIPGCPEGALQIIDGKARLISDLFCDGLGACLGECPEGAIEVEEREAEPYSEETVMENIVKQGPNTIAAHLKHLAEHGEEGYLRRALAVLEEKGIENPLKAAPKEKSFSGCPGSRVIDRSKETSSQAPSGPSPSELRQWPIQLHLVSPEAPYYKGADVLLAADCTAFALGGFHSGYLKNKALAIACPKLDADQEVYVEKLKRMIDVSKINTLTVLIMQVPCCRGLLSIAQRAADEAGRKVPVKSAVVSIEGEILKEEWL